MLRTSKLSNFFFRKIDKIYNLTTLTLDKGQKQIKVEVKVSFSIYTQILLEKKF